MRSDNVMVSFANFRTKTEAAIVAGQEIEMEKTVNAPYEALKVFGKSEQKAKWHQAEGVTTQIQETGYNLLDCEAEWLPVGNDGEKGITNIVTGKGSVSFDFDGNGVPYLENQKAIHLKAGSYYVSGLNSGSLDSVGFSGISEPLWNSCNGVITVPEEGDYKFYIYPMSYAHSMTISNLMIVEGDTSKTYQEYGYSKPSPAYPSELTSHIPAGSYQIPTENGIYEVTLTEDLRGLDDTYRDFIRFDSVSGTGYLEQNTLLVRMTRANLAPYRNTSDVTYRFSGTSAFAKYLPKTNASASILCNRLKRYHLTSELLANDIVGVSNYTESGMAYNNVYIFLSKSDIGITADDTADTMQEKAYTYLDENPLYILVGGYSYREELTFTKVESSTLPVLPWTAYGRNLFDGIFESGFYDSSGEKMASNYIRGASYIPVQPNTRYYVLNNKPDDTFLWYDSGKNFLSEVSDLSEPSPANACYLRLFFYGTDKTTQYMLCIGAKPTAYEPFNPTPPEALEVSPDYPQKIYDLSDVTVTSRGRNLTPIHDYNFNNMPWNQTLIEGVYTKPLTICFDAHLPDITNHGILRVYYSDGTTAYRTKASPSTVDATPEKYITKIILTRDSSGNKSEDNYLSKIAIYEGAYTADTLPPFDKYRCTSATIPLTLRSCGDDKDYIVSDGQAVNLNACVKEIVIDGTLNNFVCNVVGSAGDPNCQFFVRNNVPTYDRLKQGSSVQNSHGFTAQAKSDSGNYLPYIIIPWSVLGLTSAPTTFEANEAAKSYCAEQNALGTPLIMRYVLYTPVITDCTDTWAQDLLGLKTAPYYTKLFADKDTGGIEATYKHF